VSFKYFTGNLNYTLGNEDTSLELALLPEQVGHVVSVAGSGSRVLPLLARAPRAVTCVDLSREQLMLTELRIEALRALNHAEFLAFWGYPPRAASSDERKELFSRIALSENTREFFHTVFVQKNWESILYDGKWERTFIKLSAINRALTGTRGLGLFNALTEEEQRSYLKRKFPRRAWGMVLLLVGNAGMFNALLYKGHFPKKNIQSSFLAFYRAAFERLFSQGLARRNFFLQLVFFGKVVFAEGCPVECDPVVFERAKKAVADAQIRYRLGSVLDEVLNTDQPVDFVSISDVPSYFSGSTEQNFLQRIKPALTPGALVVLRSYLHVPEGLDISGFENIREHHADAIAREKMQMYLVDVYRKLS